MWALRAAVRPGAWVSRVVRGRGAPKAAPPLPALPDRALAAFGPGGLKGPGGGGRGPRADGPSSRTGEEEEEPEDAEEEEEEEELLRRDPLLPAGTQRVCLIHPEVKRGPRKQQLNGAEGQVAEAEALVHTLGGWSVVERMVVPSKTPEGKLIFGKGTLERLTEKIRGSPEITAVFLNVERLATPTKKELEASWGVPVFDRFTVVLHIFRCNARTKEARLQVALAELPLLRSHLKSSTARPDGQGQGSRYIMGSGESFMQVQQRLLKEKEMKIRKALERLRQKRRLLGRQRRRQEFPVIAVVGYTNCGESPSGREKWGPRCPRTLYPCAGPVCLGRIRRKCTKTVALRGPTREHRWKTGLPSSGGHRAHGPHPVGSWVWLSSAGRCTGLLSLTRALSWRSLSKERGNFPQNLGRDTGDTPRFRKPLSAPQFTAVRNAGDFSAAVCGGEYGGLGSSVAAGHVRGLAWDQCALSKVWVRTRVHLWQSQATRPAISGSSVLSPLTPLDPIFPCTLIMVSMVFLTDILTHTEVVPVGARGGGIPGGPSLYLSEAELSLGLPPSRYSPAEPQAVAVSALLGHGLPELKARLEDTVLRATGRQVLTLRVRLAGAQLSWLHREAAVQDVDVIPEAGAADVTVVISKSAYGKFRKLFPE
ncbi:putative GTP-binding protein 6 [Enhydra lutris kenyoni]|uniref:GTP-binding protein 6 n=1 Tax=Enhydra lutris kenyoni TaxID=391180 RepID=A0A2Y9KJK3_ENHLU|nr:putative GTP-binding protein 6 [Enhydra lutris kenyoni]